MKKIILLLLLPLLLMANVLKIDENVTPITISSQHSKEYTLVENGIWIIAKDKKRSYLVNEYYEKTHMPKDVSFIVDASQIPSMIFTLFVKPKMKKYEHPILLCFDEEFIQTLPSKEEYLTILHIQNKKIVKIVFVNNKELLAKELSKSAL